jgi:hypothetical protein
VDASDFCPLVAVAPLTLVLVYLLGILLRVGCHYTGVEIPALGRAFFVASLTTAVTVLAGYLCLLNFVGLDLSRPRPLPLFIALGLTLLANALVSVATYRALLELSLGRAITLWRWQVLLFGLLAIILCCCVGVPLQMLD